MACSGVMSATSPAGSGAGSPYGVVTSGGGTVPGRASNNEKTASSPNRIQYQMAVMDLGRNSLAMGKILKRQITKYLEECRNRESSNQGIKAALKLKVRKSDPPPVPKVDYTASVADDDSYQDDCWDTDFDDDLEEDEASQDDERDGTKRSQTNVNSRLQQPDRHQTSNLRENGQGVFVPGSLRYELDGQRRQFERPAEVPAKKTLPKPPNSLISLHRAVPRPPSLLLRPQQQPPPPPAVSTPPPAIPTPLPAVPTVPPVILNMMLKTTLKGKNDDHLKYQENACDDTNGGYDNYEIPLMDGGSKSSSVDLQGDSGSGSIDLSARSSTSSPLPLGSNSHLTGFDSSPNHSQLELENEDENYEPVDESHWSGSSSGVSVMSNQSDRPALPPKFSSPTANYAPPPLPEKPQQRLRLALTPPLPTKEKPLLPQRKTSANNNDDSSSKNRQRNDCKQVLSRFISNIASRMERRSESMIGIDKVSTPDRETMPTPEEKSNLKHCNSATSLRFGDNLSLAGSRPLPPVPTRNTNDRTTKEDSQINEQPTGATQTLSPPPRSPTTDVLLSQPWFHRVERENAESILKRLGKSGSYLVRESRRAGQDKPYTLTIFFEDTIFNVSIRHRKDGMFALGTEKVKEKTFDSVSDLVSFHQREVILLTAKGMPMGQTCLIYYPPK